MKGLIQNQLKSQSLEAVDPSAFKQVGGVIFPDSTANMDMARLASIVEAFQAVHSPNFGQPVPQTGDNPSVVGSENLLVLTGNQVSLVQFISITNSGGAPVEVSIQLGGTTILSVSVGPTSTEANTNLGAFYVDSKLSLAVAVDSGTASGVTTTAVTMRVCQ